MLVPVTFVNQIFRNFAWNDDVKSFFCIVGTSWMGWGRVEWYWHMGMSYLTSLNTQLFKNIAYVGSFGHILFNLIFNVNSNLAESSANCSAPWPRVCSLEEQFSKRTFFWYYEATQGPISNSGARCEFRGPILTQGPSTKSFYSKF